MAKGLKSVAIKSAFSGSSFGSNSIVTGAWSTAAQQIINHAGVNTNPAPAQPVGSSAPQTSEESNPPAAPTGGQPANAASSKVEKAESAQARAVRTIFERLGR